MVIHTAYSEKQQEYETKTNDILYSPREQQYGPKLQQCDLQSRSLSVLMITRDSFSASMYFKGNKSTLLMLQAHLIRICIDFIVAVLIFLSIVFYV